MKDENVELVLIGGDFLDNSYKSITDDIKSIIDENQCAVDAVIKGLITSANDLRAVSITPY